MGSRAQPQVDIRAMTLAGYKRPALDPGRGTPRAGDWVRRRMSIALRAGWVLIAIATVAFAGAAYFVSSRHTAQYEASARVFLKGAALSANGSDPVRQVLTQSQLAMSVEVVTRVASELRLPSAAVASRVATEAAPNGNYFTVMATSTSPTEAVSLVATTEKTYRDLVASEQSGGNNAILEELVTKRASAQAAYDSARSQSQARPTDARLKAKAAVLAIQLRSLATQEESAFTASALTDDPVQLMEQVQLPTSRTSPKPTRDGLLGGILGFLLVSTLLWLRSDRLATVGRVNAQAETGLSSLGELGRPVRSGRFLSDHFVPGDDLYAKLALAFDLEAPVDSRTFVFVPTESGDLTAEMAFGITRALARDRRVVLVDGDLNKGSLTRAFESLGSKPEKSSIPLTSGVSALPPKTEIGGTVFVPAQEVLGRDRRQAYSSLMAELAGHGDIVLVVLPPLDSSPSAQLFAASADAAVLVVRRETSLSLMVRSRDRLDALERPTLGYILSSGVDATAWRRVLDWLHRLLGKGGQTGQTLGAYILEPPEYGGNKVDTYKADSFQFSELYDPNAR